MQTVSTLTRLIMTALMLFSMQSWGSASNLLLDLHNMRLISTNVVANFYMFTGLDADNKYDRLMQQGIHRFAVSMEAAKAVSSTDDIARELDGIEQDWIQLEKLVMSNRNEMMTKGFPDVRMADDMGRINQAMINKISALYNRLAEEAKRKNSVLIEDIHELALLMQEITAQYAARGTSNLGQVFVGNSERSLEQMAVDFKDGIDKLDTKLNKSKTANIMADIRKKWQFMERSVRNYNENTVPFLVVSYNDRIIEHFQELESML